MSGYSQGMDSTGLLGRVITTESLGFDHGHHLDAKAVFHSAELTGLEESKSLHRQLLQTSKRSAVSSAEPPGGGESRGSHRGRLLMGNGGTEQKTDTDGRDGEGASNGPDHGADWSIFFSQVFSSAGFIVVASMATVAGVIARHGQRQLFLSRRAVLLPAAGIIRPLSSRGATSMNTPLVAARTAAAPSRSATTIPHMGPNASVQDVEAPVGLESVETEPSIEVNVHAQSAWDWILHPAETYSAVRYQANEWKKGETGGIASLLGAFSSRVAHLPPQPYQ